ncbi:MAG: chemotaxis protein MotB [Alphaproteobacteria bacterium]|nr:MAG: chemotaxis protein MotB [Alphaproteobacteria bacterium]
MSQSGHIDIKVVELPYAHHGGAWKVAYADFVTAMMAFFLLMWLLNATTKEQKNAISDYFNPSHAMISDSKSGAGGLMGGLTMSPEGAMASNKSPIIKQQVTKQIKRGSTSKSTVGQARKAAEKKRFEKTAEKIIKAIQESKALAKLAKNLLIDVTPEGLRIQIIDQDGESMFPPGSARMFEKTKRLLEKITEIVLDMPNELSIRGHTDATRYAKGAIYTNWELSADRANASRRVMLGAGIPVERLNNVMGKADTLPLIVDDPLDPRNRRITLILLNEVLTAPPAPEEDGDLIEDDSDFIEQAPSLPAIPINPYQKTPGAVEFP